MKHLLFPGVLILALLFSTTAYTQKTLKPKTTEEVSAALCDEWKVAGIQDMGMRLPPPITVDFTNLVLNNDGTYTYARMPDREEIGGKWTYTPKTMMLLLEHKDGNLPVQILHITATEFFYRSSKDKTLVIIMQRVE